MNRINLKEHMESFKQLPRNECSILERACESGLALTPYAVVGKGRQILKENKELLEFVEKLNQTFPLFEKTTKNKKKLEGILKHKKERYKDYFNTKEKPGSTLERIDTYGAFINFFTCLFYGGIFHAEASLDALPPAYAAWFIPTFIHTISVIAGMFVGEEEKHYYGPLALIGCTTAYLKDKQSLRRLQRRVKKGQEKLGKEVFQKRFGPREYSKKWFKNMEKSLLKDLLSCEENFPARFMEMEKKFLPKDRLTLYKKIEKEIEKKQRETDFTQSLEKIEYTLRVVELAKKSGSLEKNERVEKIKELIKEEIRKRKLFLKRI